MFYTLSSANAHAKAGSLVRQARAELNDDHPASALVSIHQALSELEQPYNTRPPEELLALERAARHVRCHETSSAVAALDAAIVRLAS